MGLMVRHLRTPTSIGMIKYPIRWLVDVRPQPEASARSQASRRTKRAEDLADASG